VYQCASVCGHSHGRISSSTFTKIGTDVRTPKRKNEFVGVNTALPLSLFCPQNLHFRPRGPENHAEVEIRPFCACAIKICNIALIYSRIAEILTSLKKSGSRNTMVTSDFRPEVEIWPMCACAMHPAIIIVTVRSLWTWLWGRCHIPQNVFLVFFRNFGFHQGALLVAVCILKVPMYRHIFIRIRFRIHFLVSVVSELGIISTGFLTSKRKKLGLQC